MPFRMGGEAFVVSDNGSGILTANYDKIGLKHYTSKIDEFKDLSNLKSFGFRGMIVSLIIMSVL